MVLVVVVGELTASGVTASVRIDAPVIVDKAATDGNDATAGDAGGARDGSGNARGEVSGGPFL